MDKNEIALQLTLKVLEKHEFNTYNNNSKEFAIEISEFTATMFNTLLKTLEVEN